ncbi:MAG: amidase family protein, partial [Desulfobacterales bacterium]
MSLYHLTIEEAHRQLVRGDLSAVTLTRAVLARIADLEPRIDAYLTLDSEGALQQAAAADRKIARGAITPLTGIPLGIKDVICTRGLRTTCGSRLLENFIPPYDAAVMERLRAAGAVILGKLNMDEFAMGSSTENSAYKVTRNPWNLDHIPGGSSGGSAAAVAAGMCLGALGSDTGGSIRQPAAHCGVVGLKPTYGRVSRYGLVAFASSLDQIGPMGRSVRDCALIMNAISGHDPRDSTSVPEPVPDFRRLEENGFAGLRVGLPVEYHQAEGLDPDVGNAMTEAIATAQSLGAETVEVSLPHTAYAVAAYYIIAPCEASSNLARYDGVRFGVRSEKPADLLDMFRQTRTAGFGAEVQRRIILGTYA